MSYTAECDVCVLIRSDRRQKQVQYCGSCGAWLCDDCKSRYDLRAIAAMKKKALELLNRLKEGV